MSTQEEEQDRIERYVLGTMPATERATFEAACAQNPVRSEAVALERDVRLIARASRMLELKDALQVHALGRRSQPRFKLWHLAVASLAVAVTLVLVAYLIWMQPPAYRGMALEIASKNIAKGSEAPSLQPAINLLSTDKPDPALPLLYDLRYDADAKTAQNALFYLGIAHALKENADSSAYFLLVYRYAHPNRDPQHLIDAKALLDKF
jgi:hypothetical protein